MTSRQKERGDAGYPQSEEAATKRITDDLFLEGIEKEKSRREEPRRDRSGTC